MAAVIPDLEEAIAVVGASVKLDVRHGVPGLQGHTWRIAVEPFAGGLRLTRPLHPSEGRGTTSVIGARGDRDAALRLVKAAVRDMKRLEARADAILAAGYDLASPPAWSLRAHPVMIAALRHGRRDVDPSTWKTRSDDEMGEPTRERRYVATDDRHVTMMAEFRTIGDRIEQAHAIAMLSPPNGKARRVHEFHNEVGRDAVVIHGFSIPLTVIPDLVGQPLERVVGLGCEQDATVTGIDTENGKTVLYTEPKACWIAEPPPHVDLTWRD